MARQSEDAITDANSALVAFGYYTPVIVLRGESAKTVLDQARLIASEVRRDGFPARIESVNALEAWLGSLPGHIVQCPPPSSRLAGLFPLLINACSWLRSASLSLTTYFFTAAVSSRMWRGF
jgi:hypothetical protein